MLRKRGDFREKKNYDEIINSIINEPNIVILIEEDGSQKLNDANDSHVLSMKRLIEKKFPDLYQEIIENPELEDFMNLVKEITKRNSLLICKHVDTYGVFLPERFTKKQLIELRKDLFYIKFNNYIYSCIYNKETDDTDALHYGKLMKKHIFYHELKDKKIKCYNYLFFSHFVVK